MLQLTSFLSSAVRLWFYFQTNYPFKFMKRFVAVETVSPIGMAGRLTGGEEKQEFLVDIKSNFCQFSGLPHSPDSSLYLH
jgi:hypothetical protein